MANYKKNNSRKKKTWDKKKYDSRESSGVSEETKSNDPSWYVTDKSMLTAVASYPFGLAMGVPQSYFGDNTQTVWDFVADGNKAALPGILAMNFVPTIGDTESAASAANTAAQAVYTAIRSKNSGAKNYEPADVMMYLICMDSIYMFYGWMCRIYGAIYSYNQRNRYLPKSIVQAMGVEFDDIVTHIADLKAYIDYFQSRASTMVAPADMTYFQRHYYLATNIFIDANSPKAQFYMFNPAEYMLYDGYTDRQGGRAIPSSPEVNDNGNYTFATIMQFGNQMLERVLTDVDCGTISGDILKAFESNTMRLAVMPYEYNITPIFDAWVLLQVHNADIIPGVLVGPVEQTEPISEWEGRRLYQRNQITWNAITDENWQMYGGKMIDAFVDDVTPEMVMEMTRFMYHRDPGEPYSEQIIRYPGSEIITSANIYVMGNNTTNVYSIPFQTVEVWYGGDEAEYTSEFVRDIYTRLHLITKFDYAPPVFIFNAESGLAESWNINAMIGDVTNPIYFDTNKLQNINEMAFTKMFNAHRYG